MRVTLHPDLDQYVREKVRSGSYRSISEVIVAALAELRAVEQAEADPAYQSYLRREVGKGIEQLDRGEAAPWSAAEIKAEGRRRAIQL